MSEPPFIGSTRVSQSTTNCKWEDNAFLAGGSRGFNGTTLTSAFTKLISDS